MHTQQQCEDLFRRTFGATAEVVARAPGRIEFIGNHTDYNAGVVLGAAVDRGIVAAARRRDDGRFRFVSDAASGEWVVQGRPLQRQAGAGSWTNYPIGVLLALENRGMPALNGLELAIASDLPPGSGLSSSAALELSSGLAFAALAGFELDRAEMVKACRAAENEFVGVPCGILDQGVSGFGARDHLVHIDCRGPDFSTVPLPAGVHFWVFNTHQKHALVDSLYATRHAECMAAAKILHQRNPRIQWLADADVAEVRAAKGFLPATEYRRALHVVEEIARVGEMRKVLAAGDLAAAGALLFASHESSRVLFENSTPELDALVEALRDKPGVHGARLTGGGFGGAVMALTSDAFDAAAAEDVAQAYERRFGSRPDALSCITAAGAQLLRA